MYQGPNGITMVEETFPKEGYSVLNDDFKGMTWKQVQEKLAPGTKIAPELASLTFKPKQSVPAPVVTPAGEGATNDPSAPAALAKTSALKDAWFQQNYCWTWGAGYRCCLLNRANYPDWGWTNCMMSFANILMYSGTQVNFKLQVGSSNLFNTTILNDGRVHCWTTYSGTNWLGLRKQEVHRYDVYNTSGQGWHWAVNSDIY